MKTISEPALIARIKRKLAHEGETLRVSRSANGYDGHRYGVIDRDRNFITGGTSDIEEYGRELGVLRPGERLAQ